MTTHFRARGLPPSSTTNRTSRSSFSSRKRPSRFTSYEDAPEPELGLGDALIRVHATGITPAELTWPETYSNCDGSERLPTIPGHEVSGVVESVADGVSEVSIGNEVYALTSFCRNGGATRERSWQVLKPTGILVSLPVPIPDGEAAAYSRRGLFFIVEPNREQLGEIAALIDSGSIRPVIAETIPLARAREAIERGVAGHTRGKLVLLVTTLERASA
jgi:NADPH:quinone reductase-like Zn-dependent oxidoreductase